MKLCMLGSSYFSKSHSGIFLLCGTYYIEGAYEELYSSMYMFSMVFTLVYDSKLSRPSPLSLYYGQIICEVS
jgi:hypothetical protein